MTYVAILILGKKVDKHLPFFKHFHISQSNSDLHKRYNFIQKQNCPLNVSPPP